MNHWQATTSRRRPTGETRRNRGSSEHFCACHHIGGCLAARDGGLVMSRRFRRSPSAIDRGDASQHPSAADSNIGTLSLIVTSVMYATAFRHYSGRSSLIKAPKRDFIALLEIASFALGRYWLNRRHRKSRNSKRQNDASAPRSQSVHPYYLPVGPSFASQFPCGIQLCYKHWLIQIAVAGGPELPCRFEH